MDDPVDGIALDAVSDVDGDGLAELAVGTPFVSNGAIQHAGRVRVLATREWTEIASHAGDRSGETVGRFVAGSLDGRALVYAGAPEFLSDPPGSGRILVLDARAHSVRVLEPNVPCSRFGWSASPMRDANNDGIEDLIVVGFEDGQGSRDGILLVSGSDGRTLGRIAAPPVSAEKTTAVTTTRLLRIPGDDEAITVVGAPIFDRFYVVEADGPELRVAQSVLGPGFSGFGDDVGIVSTRLRGTRRVLTFGVGLPDRGTLDTVECPQVNRECRPLQPMDDEGQLGSAVTTCPDLDGDGLDDLIAGAPGLPTRQGFFGVEGLGVDDRLRDKIRDTRGYLLFIGSSTGKVLSKLEGSERGFGKAIAVLRSDRDPSKFLVCVGSGTCQHPIVRIFDGRTSTLILERSLD